MKGMLLAVALLLAASQPAGAAGSARRQIAKAVVSYAINVQHQQLIPAVDNVAVVGRYAIADWSSGENDGESLATLSRGGWHILAAQGRPFEERSLVRRGVPSDTAQALMAGISTMERGRSAAG